MVKLGGAMKAAVIIVLLGLIGPTFQLYAAQGVKSYAGIYCLPPGEKPGKPVNLAPHKRG